MDAGAWEAERDAKVTGTNQVFVDPNSDSPFQVLQVELDQGLSAEEKLEKETTEIVDLY